MNVKNRDEDILKFLKKSVPDSVSVFMLKGDKSTGGLDASFYLEGLENICSRAKVEIAFINWDLSAAILERVVISSQFVFRLNFVHWRLDINNELDFSGPEYWIKVIDFQGWGDKNKGNWERNQKKPKRLIKAISECGIKETIEELWFYKCGLEIQEISDMLKCYGLQKVDIKRNGLFDSDEESD